MKEGWQKLTIGDVSDIIHGKNQKEVESPNGPYPIYGSGGNIMGYANEYLCEPGTIILGRKGSINNPQYITTRFWNVDTAFGIRAKENCDSKFLFYYISNIDWNKYNTGTTLPSLTQSVVYKVKIPVPPIPEQERIVKKLDAAFEKIDQLKKNAENGLQAVKDLWQSALRDELKPKEGWVKKELRDLLEDITYGTSVPSCENGEYVYLRMNNISNDGTLDLKGSKTINLSEKELEKCLVRNGDILFNRTNSRELVGKTCVFNLDTPMVIAGYIIRIRLKSGLDSQFVSHCMNYKRSLGQFENLIVGAVHQANISAKAIQTITISFPSLQEQQTIVSKLDHISSICQSLQTNYEQELAEYETLKQSILRKAFSGNL